MSNNGKKQSQPKNDRPKKRRKGMCLEDRPILENSAAGVDVGAREMFVAVPPDRDTHPVQVFNTFTEDLHRLADWLVACGVTTVAMESTGVYWIPALRYFGRARVEAVPGQCTTHEECARTAHRLA